MKRLTFSCLGLMLLCSLSLRAQQVPVAAIRDIVEQPEVEMHIRFLASDELGGRDVGSQGLEVWEMAKKGIKNKMADKMCCFIVTYCWTW